MRRHQIGLIAPLNGGVLTDLALHAIADLRLRQRRVLAEHVLGDQPQAVLVLEEAALVGAEVGALRRPAEHLEGSELDDRRLEPRAIDDDGRRVGLDDGAGEDDREALADADGPCARAPPALNRIGLHVLRGQRAASEKQGCGDRHG